MQVEVMETDWTLEDAGSQGVKLQVCGYQHFRQSCVHSCLCRCLKSHGLHNAFKTRRPWSAPAAASSMYRIQTGCLNSQ
jgi:hypothetical protein